MIKIDIDTRCWQIPKEECFLGVESDDKVKILRFELSKNEFCNGLNFTDCNCFINYKNEGNDTIPYLITDMEVQVDGTVTFTWQVSRGATIFKGNTFAVLCAKKVSDDGTITNEWNSRIGSFTVAKGIEPSSSIAEVPEIDIISQLLLVAKQTNENAQTNINQSSQLLEKAEGLGYLKEDFDVLEARMNQFTSLKEGSTTGDAELIDGRVGYDGKVHDNIGGAIRGQIGKLKGDLGDLYVHEYPKNLFDKTKVTSNKYLNPNGTIEDLADRYVTDYIPVKVGKTVVMSFDFNKVQIKQGYNAICCYDNNKKVVSGGNYNQSDFTVPSGVAYVRITTVDSMIKNISQIELTDDGNFTSFEDYFEPYIKICEDVKISNSSVDGFEEISKKVNILSGDGFFHYEGNLNSGESFELLENNIKNYQVFAFSADIATFDTLWIGRRYENGNTYGAFEINSTNVIFHCDDGTTETVAHGLDIGANIQILLENENTPNFKKMVICSCGKTFDVYKTLSKVRFIGDEGMPFVKSVGSTLLRCSFSWTSRNIKKPIIVCGDSYISLYDTRWVNYLIKDGYDKSVLLHGYAGESVEKNLSCLKNILTITTPKYIVWCMGMNNPDTTTGVNDEWKSSYDEIKSICDTNGIELILATIPNVPNRIHTFKNDIVRNSGYRYIDFAYSVGGNTKDSTWYSGLLSEDNVHPTKEGAKALYYRVLADLPEITMNN